jgi:ATP-dependent Clp protease ATP-binding subunit ClpA
VPPGYIGYVRGKGGILSRIRDFPACVVLFDEFEKASRGVGELLLGILHEGRAEDSDGNLLDFRRSFIIFTSNAGCTYEQATMGFDAAEPEKQKPTVDEEALLTELRRRVGLDQAFLARISHKFFFQALDQEAIGRVLVIQLERLSQTAEIRGYRLTWEPQLIKHLASQWQPRFGVRFLTSMLHHRITEMLSVLEAQGTLAEVSAIRLAKLQMPRGAGPSGLTGGVTWRREDDTLIISIT